MKNCVHLLTACLSTSSFLPRTQGRKPWVTRLHGITRTRYAGLGRDNILHVIYYPWSWGFPVVIAREFSRPSRSSGDEQARYNEHQVQTEVGKNKECQCMWYST